MIKSSIPRNALNAIAKLSLVMALMLTSLSRSLFAAEPKPPNLIVIMTDDQGYADVSFNGGQDIPTPQIDRIAADGVVFTDAYVTAAVCSPSRAGFITGRYQQRFGHERNVAWRPHDPTVGLPLKETTLADALGSVGYTSAIIGKWHLGANDVFHPLSRGFDEFFGHLGGGLRYWPDDLTIPDYRNARNEPESYRTWIVRNHEPVQTTRYLTDEFTHEALDFIRRQADNHPFFLFLSYNAPHAPMQAPAEDVAAFSHVEDEKRRIYSAMVTVVDRGVGQLLDLLDELDLTDNTLVFFLSDNGGPTHANGSNNYPLRGGKGSPFEGGIRVPFAARWPGVFPAGITYTQPVSSLDIFATIAAVNRIPSDPDRPLDGVNLVPYVLNELSDPPHSHIYFRMFDPGIYAMRSGDYKIVKPRNIVTPRLFNLRNDLSETDNIANANASLVEDMLGDYGAWNAQLIEPVFPGLDMREWRRPQPPVITSR